MSDGNEEHKIFSIPESYLDKVYEFTGNGEDGGFILAYVNQQGEAMIQCKISSQIIEMGLRKALERFLDDIALQQDRDEEDESIGGVSLITLHAAKGLEFPAVYMVGVEEGILPHKRSIEEGTKEEERRLFYVGMTRAMERLTMSYCVNRKKYGEVIRGEPSSFLEELDPTYIDVMSNDEAVGAPLEDGDAQAYFSRMKEMLEES